MSEDLIQKELVDKVIKECTERDQKEFDHFQLNNLNNEALADMYFTIAKEYCNTARELYHCAWQTYDMLKGIDENKAREISTLTGNEGIAHHIIAHTYKTKAFELSGMEVIL